MVSKSLSLFDNFNSLTPYSVGYDSIFDRLNSAIEAGHGSNYPPYNIKKKSDYLYEIELAVAGFGKKDIDVEVEGESLTIRGNRPEDASEGLVHQGLAARSFIRKFVLSDDMEIKGAALSNGMLYIGMERLIPEHRRPKKISLTSKKKLLG